MNYFTRDALKGLAQTEHAPCVSLFMPTNRADAEHTQNHIRLKNLLRDARRQLKASDVSEDTTNHILQPAQELLERVYWGEISEGLIAFLYPDEGHLYNVPLDLEELVVVGERFHLKPLFPLIASNNRFYLLTLSQNRVKLYQGSHQSLTEVHTDEIPESLVDALYFDDPERSIQHHTGNRAAGRHDAIFHGQGVQDEDQRRRPHDALYRFFRHVDRGLKETLRDETAPLLLAGVEQHLPIYREVNSYLHLIEATVVAGNSDYLAPHELHAKAWSVVAPIFLEAQQQALEAYENQQNANGMASSDVHEIIPAAVFSRVDTLFVPVGEHLWGRYDASENAVTIHEQQETGDDDLYDLAAVQTYLNGGMVHALQSENMPVDSGLAATFRYPAQIEAASAS